MEYYIGIDLGTSSVKTLLLNNSGEVIATITKQYPLYLTPDGYSEQMADDWYNQTIAALKELLNNIDKTAVKSISFSGQMHGLVLLDKSGNVIRPAILWNDSRASYETEQLNADKNFLLDSTGNIAFAGFTLPKLLWVKQNEPENYAKIDKILLPKDYLCYRLTGEFVTDVSDASGTLYFDVNRRDWSDDILKKYEICSSWLPRVLESDSFAGNLKHELQNVLGVNNIKVIIGAGDNAAAAVGTGTIKSGDCNISLGTSGTIFTVSDSYNCDRINAIHSFCSASRSYHYMACMLSAAVCSDWWINNILRDDFSSVNSQKDNLGKNEVLFLPYLMGERSPLNDTDIRGLFYGLSLSTTKDHMSLAVLEGVAFALRHNLDVIKDLGVQIKESNVCGGGTKNELWLSIIASILNVPLHIPKNQDGAALGAAMLAAKGVMSQSEYSILESLVYVTDKTVLPDPQLTELYNLKYQKWLKLYPAVKDI